MSNNSVRWAFNSTTWNPAHSEMMLATSCIQAEEKERLAKFIFKEDFKSSLIGRLLMRKFVNEFQGIPYNEIRFCRDEKGKPFLSDKNCNINFNVSHQGDYVVLAGELEHVEMGVDVMKNEYAGGKTVPEFFRIMNRQFSALEWQSIKNCRSETEQVGMFCRHWALKESYVKAIGVGITTNLQDITFKVNTQTLAKDALVTDTKLILKNEVQNWMFEESLLDNHHCVAVAVKRNTSSNLFFKEVSFSELTANSVSLFAPDELYTENFFKKLCKK